MNPWTMLSLFANPELPNISLKLSCHGEKSTIYPSQLFINSSLITFTFFRAQNTLKLWYTDLNLLPLQFGLVHSLETYLEINEQILRIPISNC